MSSTSTNGALDLGCFNSLEKKFEASITYCKRFSFYLETNVSLFFAYFHCAGIDVDATNGVVLKSS